MNKNDELIIVVPRVELFNNEKDVFQGLFNEEYMTEIFKLRINLNMEIMRRGDAEKNECFKQPIPYAIIKRGQEIFVYKRLSGGGESRLHDKLSIGAGGHMNFVEDAKDFNEILDENLYRELTEELDINGEYEIKVAGLINDDENEVGRVHIGLLVIIELDENGSVEVRETEQLEGLWMTKQQLLEEETFAKLESWSQIATKSVL
jgi:predicted NUDIX family phosphoesterase